MRTRIKTAHSEPQAVSTGRPVFTGDRAGFTLLEVLVALTVLAVGAAITVSVLSGSLGNIRKVQLRTRVIVTAQNIMEQSLYREDLQQPTVYEENLEDGFRCIVQVQEYEPVINSGSLFQDQAELPVKLMQYTVEMIGPDSPVPAYQLQTLKLVNTSQEGQ
jgi:prepilin-type N-terminal cleavage/methylation domain-containing protein